ncbi:BTAD domain-containing putative transcriptional regulator [Gordonia sp. PKS22-38]|uniref:BTAD domain-containing putative transcriptional regulator n=1 Tax=Gordonia prachuapensis TaxID=3115651 RepID=A0ABU7MZX8_9ACTN|nr:BTAD domain-containing putative transcriptional regulator [Gordonia sp. PKS22-38]
MVSLLLLGPVDVPAQADEPAADQFGSPRLRCLLAALALRANAVADVDWLAEILWPHTLPSNPESALHNLVFRLRAQLRDRGVGERVRIVTAAPGYSLKADRTDVDSLLYVDRFREGCAVTDSDPVAALNSFDAAESLWRGRPYGEFADEPWARADVEALEQVRARIAEAAADALLRSGRPVDAADRLDAVAVDHPYRESVHLLRMHALWQADRPADALEVYRQLRQRLSTDLGTEPAARLAALHEQILAGQRPPERTQQVTTGRPADHRIIGRTAELAHLAARLRPGTLVTVVGPGGVGKTALVRELGRHRETVWTAELAGVQTADDVVHSVASATQSAPRRDLNALEALVESLTTRAGLLILDNCEHVADAAADVARAVTARCRDVAVVATSRVPLGVDVEQVWALDPLAVPSPNASPAETAQAPAVRLFCARASARDSGFELTDGNYAAVAEICRRLDGLPLGVELAATKTRAISPAALVDRLQWRFRILRSARGGDPRHRSLHALVDWSYTLLTDPARTLFDTVAVFPSRFDLGDAETLAEASGALDRADVADAVAELVDTSMLSVDADDYRMLETLRVFGLQRLEDRGGLPSARAAHARLTADRIEPLGRELFGPRHVEAATIVATHLDDVRQAVDHACDHDAALGQRLLRGVIPYLELTMSTEVTEWSRRVRAAQHAPRDPADGDGAAWAVAAAGARFDGDLTKAKDCVHTGLACRPEPAVAVYLHMMLVEVGLFQGDLEAMYRCAENFRGAAQAAGMPGAGRMADLCVLLMDSYRGEGLAAHQASRRIADTCAAAGENTVAAWARYCAGECILDTDPAAAADLLDDAIVGADRNGDRYLMGVALVSRASIEARSGQPEVAARLFADVLRHWRDAGNWTHQWVSLRTVVDVLIRLERLDCAAELLGAIRRSDEITGAGAYGTDAQRLDAAYQRLRECLGDEALDNLLERGAVRSSPDVVASALAALSPG